MLNQGFFTSSDKKVKDYCPVCHTYLGLAYEKTERIYDCIECNLYWIFHINETTGKHIKKKNQEKVVLFIQPSWEERMPTLDADEDYWEGYDDGTQTS